MHDSFSLEPNAQSAIHNKNPAGEPGGWY
jgi:hypothetical protein